SQRTSAEMQVELFQRRAPKAQQIGRLRLVGDELAQARQLGAVDALDATAAGGRQALELQFREQCIEAAWRRRGPFQQQAVVIAEQLALVQVEAHLAFGEEDDPLRQTLDLVQVMAGVDHRAALAGERLHGIEQQLARVRVDTHRGFVEQVQTGGLEQADGEIEPTLLPAGQARRTLPEQSFEAGRLNAALQSCVTFGAAQPVEIGEQLKVFPNAQLGIEGRLLRHQADSRFAV